MKIRRVLILTHHKHINFERQAEFHAALNGLVKAYPQIDFIYPVPDTTRPLPQLPNLFYFRADYYLHGTQFNRMRALDEIHIDRRVIDAFVAKHCPCPVDLVVTEKPQLVGMLKQFSSCGGRDPVPVIVYEPYLKAEFLKNLADRTDTIESLQTLGYLHADRVIAISGLESKNIVQLIKKHFLATPQMIDELDIIDFVPAFDPVTIDPATKKDVILYGQKLQAVRKPKETIAALKQIAEMRREISVFVASQNVNVYMEELENQRNLKRVSLNREDFAKLLASTKVSFTLSEHEETARGICEMILHDVIVMLPFKPWAISIVGEKYPFFIQSVEKLPQDVLFHLDNYARLAPQLKDAKAKIMCMSTGGMLDGFEPKLENNNRLAIDFFVHHEYRLPQVFGFTEHLLPVIASKAKTGLSNALLYEPSFPSTRELLQGCHSLGWHVTTDPYGAVSVDKGSNLRPSPQPDQPALS